MKSEMVLDASETLQERLKSELDDFSRSASENASGLAQMSAKANSESLADAVSRIRPDLVKQAYGILHNTEDAVDAVSQAMVTAFSIDDEQKGKPKKIRSWAGWLMHVTRLNALMTLRQRRRLTPIDAVEAEAILDLATGETETTTSLFANELAAIVKERKDKGAKRLLKALSEADNEHHAAQMLGTNHKQVSREIDRVRALIGLGPKISERARSRARQWAAVKAATGPKHAGVCRYGNSAPTALTPTWLHPRDEAHQALKDMADVYDWQEEIALYTLDVVRSLPTPRTIVQQPWSTITSDVPRNF